MKAVPVPVYKGDPDVVQVDPLSQRVHDGIAAGRTAVARDLLKPGDQTGGEDAPGVAKAEDRGAA